MKPIITKRFDEQLDELRKQHIKEVLKGALKKVKATRRLDIERNLLSYFINKWGFDA